MQYRLHIDFQLGADEEQALEEAHKIIEQAIALAINTEQGKTKPFKMQYRVGHDEDRQKSNYLDKNENGHVSNKKFGFFLGEADYACEKLEALEIQICDGHLAVIWDDGCCSILPPDIEKRVIAEGFSAVKEDIENL